MPQTLDDEEIEGLKVACKLGREVLNEAAKACAPGVTTDELDRVVHEAAIERECYPSPLGFVSFLLSIHFLDTINFLRAAVHR